MNKKIRNTVLVAVIAVMSLLSACNDNPCADGSACGITSPHGDVMENAINWVESTDPMGTSNNLP